MLLFGINFARAGEIEAGDFHFHASILLPHSIEFLTYREDLTHLNDLSAIYILIDVIK